jgi:hypothetical protein
LDPVVLAGVFVVVGVVVEVVAVVVVVEHQLKRALDK